MSTLSAQPLSTISYGLPFSGPGLLLILPDSARDARPSSLLEDTRAHQTIWLKRSELWQLAVPNPYAVQTFSMPFWIREEGLVESGEDLRREVPLLRKPEQLLAQHLEISMFRLRSSYSLACLAQRKYAQLNQLLGRERMLLMHTALLARRIWRVYPQTVRALFEENFPDRRLCELNGELQSLRFDVTTPAEQALHMVWLHESFVRCLRRYVQ